MKRRLRVPRVLVVVVSTSALAASVATLATSCGDDEECIRCLPDPRIGDAGIDADPVTCPACLPKDGICPVGCIPDGFV